MKNLIIIIVLVSISSIQNAFSQILVSQNNLSVVAEQTTDFNPCIKKLDAIAVDGKVYLKWIVNGEKENCIFYIQRSLDGNNYETIGVKKAVGTEAAIDLLYCYTDQNPGNTKVYYRIARCFDCGKKLYSEYALVNNQDYKILAND